MLSASWHSRSSAGCRRRRLRRADSLDRLADDGRGRRRRPRLRDHAVPRRRLGRALELWIKDETGQVAGSHKARHLFGLALWLAVAERTGLTTPPTGLRARWPSPAAATPPWPPRWSRARLDGALQVFVPPDRRRVVIDRLKSLDASIVICPRREVDPPGDPCHHRFREAVEAGALPFCCQGSDNGLTIDGGMTLGFELASQHASAAPAPRPRCSFRSAVARLRVG
jgi:threonine synthase